MPTVHSTTPEARLKNPGHFLKEWREYRGYLQDEVAAELGINKGLVSRIERGVRRYNQDHLELCAKMFKCKPYELIAYAPGGGTKTELGALWRLLNPTQKSAATKMIAALAGR